MPKPDKATQEAIDARVKSSQELESNKTEMKIAEAEAKKKKIEAQGIAEYNEIIKKSMSDEEMIKYQWIQKWDGKTPKATGSNSLIQIPMDEKEIKRKKSLAKGFFWSRAHVYNGVNNRF